MRLDTTLGPLRRQKVVVVGTAVVLLTTWLIFHWQRRPDPKTWTEGENEIRQRSPDPWTWTEDENEMPRLMSRLKSAGKLTDVAEFAVDLGARQGHGPTEMLFKPPYNYAGLMVEGNPKWREELNKVVPSPKVKKVIGYITPSGVVKIFQDNGVPNNLAFLKVDIDGDDCATLAMILNAGYRPRVVQAEVTIEIPVPYAFGVLPLPSYDQGVAVGFHSCSVAMMTAIVETYGYRLVGVGGTKDALFVHKSSIGGSGGVTEAYADASFFAFADCCLAEPNPSMAVYLEKNPAEFGFTVPSGLPRPSQWMQLADPRPGKAQHTTESSQLAASIKHYMHAACRSAASKWSKEHPPSDPEACAFEYVMGQDAKTAAAEFLAKVLGSPEPST
mmetsp:Transcript_21519/g.64022  ORF Transcript_21519/g.64022 Transcript_21519/m.64022 type:complete len:387 (+) Transcript_21519:257-1417(+)